MSAKKMSGKKKGAKKNGGDNVINLEEALRRNMNLSFSDIIRGAGEGIDLRGDRLTKKEIEERLGELEQILRSQKDDSKEERVSRDVHVVYFKFPRNNILLMTLVENGKVLGGFDGGEFQLADARAGVDEITSMLANSNTFDSQSRRQQEKRTRKPSKTRKKTKPGEKPDKPIIMRHPIVDEFFEKNSQGFSLEISQNPGKAKKMRIAGIDGLSEIIDDEGLVRLAHREGFEVSVETPMSFVATHRAEIQRKNRYKEEQIKDDSEIRPAAAAVLKQYIFYDYDIKITSSHSGRNLASELLALRNDFDEVEYDEGDKTSVKIYGTKKSLKDIERMIAKTSKNIRFEVSQDHSRKPVELMELCGNSESAKELYVLLKEQREKLAGDDTIHNYMIGFRAMARAVVLRATKMCRITDEEITHINQETRSWPQFAQSAEYLETSEEHIPSYVREDIIPIIEGDEGTSGDRLFEGLSNVGRIILRPGQNIYPPIHMRFIVRGLLMLGHMKKESDGELVDRTAKGAISEYTNGLSNLMENYDTYGKLLRKSFNDLLMEGEFDGKRVDLKTQSQCSRFATRLFRNLDDEEKAEFKWLKGEKTLDERSNHLTRILRAYVGIHREEFEQAVIGNYRV